MTVPELTAPLHVEDVGGTDARHVWHPYSPARTDNLVVSSAEGVHLTLADGRRIIDGMSSWWAMALGHRHPRLIAAAHEQLDRMPHVMFGGLTHEPAARLTRNLLDLLAPEFPDLSSVFYSDSGSVAVEVAVKMALQYARGAGHPERTRLLTWRSGYHGDTFAAMSVCDPDGGMHSLWAGVLAEQVFAPAPPVRGADATEIDAYFEAMDALIDDTVAGVIIEPVVQGAGGMRFHDHALVAGVRRLCDRRGILLICDEIATGCGRTGDLFTTSAAGAAPDILCVGKTLTGGTMTLAATLSTDEVAEVVSSPAGGGALMHGPTFMANPLACAVAAEAVSLYAEGRWRTQVPRIERELERGLAGLRGRPGVADVRVLGAIGVVELTREVDMPVATRAAVDAGVWLRPFGRLVYTMPPYVATSEDVARICAGVATVVDSQEKP